MTNSVLFGALGVVIVKKTNSAIELYFAHNTDSFVSFHYATMQKLAKQIQ